MIAAELHDIHPAIWSSLFLSEVRKLCDKLEAVETPQWAARAVMRHELMPARVVDPNCGFGVLAEAAREQGCRVISNDIFNWGYAHQDFTLDFLSDQAVHHIGRLVKGAGVFMNPPFKLSIPFLKQCKKLGARKVIMFEKMKFYGTKTRRTFIEQNQPSRIYLCGERATCWIFDVPEQNRKGTTSEQFAFYVWDEFGRTAEPTIQLIYKGDE